MMAPRAMPAVGAVARASAVFPEDPSIRWRIFGVISLRRAARFEDGWLSPFAPPADDGDRSGGCALEAGGPGFAALWAAVPV